MGCDERDAGGAMVQWSPSLSQLAIALPLVSTVTPRLGIRLHQDALFRLTAHIHLLPQ
jgi:hypothetical protein